jgi:hypothetical protein
MLVYTMYPRGFCFVEVLVLVPFTLCEVNRNEVLKTWLRMEMKVAVPILIVRYNPQLVTNDSQRHDHTQDEREGTLLNVIHTSKMRCLSGLFGTHSHTIHPFQQQPSLIN